MGQCKRFHLPPLPLPRLAVNLVLRSALQPVRHSFLISRGSATCLEVPTGESVYVSGGRGESAPIAILATSRPRG